MKNKNRLFLLLLVLLLPSCVESHSDAIALRISVDTNPDHLRNITIRRFVDLINTNDELGIEATLFESGQLAKDRDIPKALHWGSLDMGVPAQSKLSRFVPEANLFTLPALYGLPQNTFFGLLQGPTGAAINTSIEQRLAVKVLGRSIPLGFATTYTTDKLLHAPDDLRGLKIRVPGGSGPVVAMVHMGASPVTLPIADVPLALAQGAINGIQSTHETVASTSLWEVGIKHCYEDRAYLLLYTPLVSLEFWKRLSEQQQETLIALWAQVTSDIEAYARERQLQAKEVLLSKGVQCTEVNPLLLGEVRNQMQSSSLALADELKISEAVLNVLATQLQEDAP